MIKSKEPNTWTFYKIVDATKFTILFLKSTMIEGVKGGGVFFFVSLVPMGFPKFPKLFLNTFPS
jgi:hypothetical protein